MRIIKCIALLLIVLLISCDNNVAFEDSLTEVTLINEIQDCEELNMHYRIIGDNHKGMIVLPYFGKKMNTEENNELFFKAFDSVKRQIKVKGYLSKEKHKEINLGCDGSHYFKIDTILNVRESILEFDINNK